MAGDIKTAEDACDEIAKELGIPVLSLSYVPSDMFFQELVFEGKRAIIKWEYNDHIIRLTELGDEEEIVNMHISDRIPYAKQHNRLLGEDVILSKNYVTNGAVEFSAEITTRTAYYLLSGIMEEDEFKKIVENMRYY